VPRTERRAARPFSILTVCTGNICRSPLAEQLLRARFAEAGFAGVEVDTINAMRSWVKTGVVPPTVAR